MTLPKTSICGPNVDRGCAIAAGKQTSGDKFIVKQFYYVTAEKYYYPKMSLHKRQPCSMYTWRMNSSIAKATLTNLLSCNTDGISQGRTETLVFFFTSGLQHTRPPVTPRLASLSPFFCRLAKKEYCAPFTFDASFGHENCPSAHSKPSVGMNPSWRISKPSYWATLSALDNPDSPFPRCLHGITEPTSTDSFQLTVNYWQVHVQS